MSGPDILPLSERWRRPYLDFAARAWGAGAYQADERYVRWLYEENPLASLADGSILVDGERVAGCVHKIRQVWRLDGVERPVVTTHNLFVEPEHRHGSGAALALHAFRGEEALFAPGAIGTAAAMHEKLRWQSIETEWYRRVTPSLTGAVRAALGGRTAYRPQSRRSFRISAEPDADRMAACMEALNAAGSGLSRPVWTRETFAWRFFHPIGPRHVLASADSRAFALFSCGVRKRVRMARLIDAASDDADLLGSLIDWTAGALARRGALLAWSYSSRPELNAIIARLGWRQIVSAPQSFLYRRGSTEPAQLALNASAGDFGFESIVDHDRDHPRDQP